VNSSFAIRFKSLRTEKGISQRRAAADLKISQALLSHYENDAREPKLEFVVKACDYYNVSADYILGISEDRGNIKASFIDEVRNVTGLLDALKSEEAVLIEKLKKLTTGV